MRPNEEVRIHKSIVNHFGAAALKINGEFVLPDFWKRAAQYKAQTAKDITDEIKVLLSEIRPDRILLTGGGALLLQNELLSNNRHFAFIRIRVSRTSSVSTGQRKPCPTRPAQGARMPNIEIISLRFNLDKDNDRRLFQVLQERSDSGKRNEFLKKSFSNVS